MLDVEKDLSTSHIAVNDQETYQSRLLNIPFTEKMLAIKEYARINGVPIMQDEGIAFLITILKIIKPKRILEIGTAIGYSSAFMAQNCDAIIDTIERDDEMIDICQKNHRELGIDNRINLIHKDALEAFDLISENHYDLIFIDAAKAQYIRFFEIYAPLLNEGGVILSDNLYFHNLLFTDIANRDLRQLVRKVNKFNEYLLSLPDYETHIFKIGDGIGLTIKK